MLLTKKQITSLASHRLRSFGIDPKEVFQGLRKGAYPDSPLNAAEFALHEAAHLLTLGIKREHFPLVKQWAGKASVDDWIGDRMLGMSRVSANQLEIDTAFLTQRTGELLELWSADATTIVESCYNNLRYHAGGKLSLATTFDAFEFRATHLAAHFMGQAQELRRWFLGRTTVGAVRIKQP